MFILWKRLKERGRRAERIRREAAMASARAAHPAGRDRKPQPEGASS